MNFLPALFLSLHSSLKLVESRFHRRTAEQYDVCNAYGVDFFLNFLGPDSCLLWVEICYNYTIIYFIVYFCVFRKRTPAVGVKCANLCFSRGKTGSCYSNRLSFLELDFQKKLCKIGTNYNSTVAWPCFFRGKTWFTHFIGWNSDLPQLYSTLSNSEQNGKFVKSTITNNFVFRFFGSSQKFQGFWVCCSSICGRSENRSICHHSETVVFIITSHSLTMQLFTIVVLAFLAVAAAFMPTGNIAR